MDAMQILVVILSIFLAFFLLLAIILVVMLIKVTRQIKKVTTTAQNAAEHMNDMAVNVSKFVSPALIAKFIMKQFNKRK